MVVTNNTLALPEWFEEDHEVTVPAVVEFGHRLRIDNETGNRVRVEIRAFNLRGQQISSAFRFDAPDSGRIRGAGLAGEAESFLLSFTELTAGRETGRTHQRLIRPGSLSAWISLTRDDNGELDVKSVYRVPPEEGQLKHALPIGWRYDEKAGDPHVFELQVGNAFVVRNEMRHTQPFHFDLIHEHESNPGLTTTITYTGVFARSGVATMPLPPSIDGMRTTVRFWLPGYSPRTQEINGDQAIHVGSIDVPLEDKPFVITLARSRRGAVAATLSHGQLQRRP